MFPDYTAKCRFVYIIRSFGVLMWEVFSLGYMPYPGRGNQEVMQLVADGGRLEVPSGCPTSIYATMELCWHKDPSERPNFTQIIAQLQRCFSVSFKWVFNNANNACDSALKKSGRAHV
jgi:Protein tyrosine and serine/threonine kinase